MTGVTDMPKSYVVSEATFQATSDASSSATMDSELPFTRRDQSITLPSAANRRCGEESTQ